jgi:hypothetical protein
MSILIPISEITYRLIETRGIIAGRELYRWLTVRAGDQVEVVPSLATR